MTQSRKPRNEKLIDDLYEKLNWYTFEASDGQFDEKEVDAIVQLLDVLEPLKEDPRFPSDPAAARERFYKRYSLEEERSGLKDTGCEDMETEPVEQKGRPEKTRIVAEDDAKAITEGKPKKRKKGFVRFAVGVAACLLLMLSVNVGSYALKKKSFFEVVRDGIGRTKVTVTGNIDDINEYENGVNTCSSWEDAKQLIGETILSPGYIPCGYRLNAIECLSGKARKVITAKYNNDDLTIKFEIDIYSEEYSNNVIIFDDDWNFIEEENNIQYYSKDNKMEAFFVYGKAVYLVMGDISLEELKKIVSNFR